MASLLLALIGIPAGLLLDALAVHFAARPDDDEEEEPSPPTTATMPRGAETGSLVIEHSSQAWARRLLTTGATAGLFAVAGARFDAADLAIVTPYICVLIVCAATDLMSFRVPNAVTYPALLGALIAGALLPDVSIAEVLIGGALAGVVFLLPALFTGGVGMGMGDVKLAAFVGLALGLTNVAPALLLTALGGGAVALLLLLTGLRKKGDPIPYAPFISAGALAAMLWQGTAFTSLN